MLIFGWYNIIWLVNFFCCFFTPEREQESQTWSINEAQGKQRFDIKNKINIYICQKYNFVFLKNQNTREKNIHKICNRPRTTQKWKEKRFPMFEKIEKFNYFVGGKKGPKKSNTKRKGHHTNTHLKDHTSRKQNKGSKNQKSKSISIFLQCQFS